MIQRHNTINAKDQYRELWKQGKTEHRHEKKVYQEEQLKEAGNLNSQKESRRFFRNINLMSFQTSKSSCSDTKGEILSNRKEFLERWNQYFKELC
jgi:hypothetical protein